MKIRFKTIAAVCLGFVISTLGTASADSELQAVNQPIHQLEDTEKYTQKVMDAQFNFLQKTEAGYHKALLILNDILDEAPNTLAFRLRGTLYYNGFGVDIDKQQALSDFESAADKDAQAAYMMALMLLKGDGVTADAELGISMMFQAADMGLADAQYEVAKTGLQNSRVESNTVLKLQQERISLQYAKLCAAQKEARCMLILADIFNEGLAGFEKSTEAASELRLTAKRINPSVSLIN